MKTTGNIPAHIMHRALANLKSTIATDDSRPILKGIHVIVKKDHIMFETLDGFKMTQFKVKDIESEEEFD